MPEREGFPAGVPSWIDTETPDPEATAGFYAGLFGWQFESRVPARPSPYIVATLDGKDVAAVGKGTASGWNTYIGVEDAEATASKVREAGGTVLTEPADIGDLGRAAACADPAGARFRIWQPGSIKGAQSVNAPGTWNFSELRTGDADGAGRFYGAVFGWKADEVDMGAMSGTLLRLPGYADFLEQFNPGIRQRHIDFGAPPGFTECIGWILPLQPDESSHWSITFSVADTDGVVARARELGAEIVVEPFDMPQVRSAVLRDPAGARFTANAFNPG